MNEQRVQTSEALRVGLVLALAGGYLDAYTYLCRGGVFANAETGNMVLLGVKLAAGDWAAAAKYLPPIFAFFLGVLAAEAIRRRGKAAPAAKLHWRQWVLALEIGVLAAAAFAPLGGAWDMAVNWAVSFVCALQVESFRRVHGKAYATTMCTGNLRSGTEHLFRHFTSPGSQSASKAALYYGLILSFVCGAVISGLASPILGGRAVLCACVPLLGAFLLMFREESQLM